MLGFQGQGGSPSSIPDKYFYDRNAVKQMPIREQLHYKAKLIEDNLKLMEEEYQKIQADLTQKSKVG
jgi:hypothetical protein